MRALGLIDIIKIPPVDGGVRIIILRHPGDNILVEYVSRASWTSFLLPGNAENRGRAAEVGPPREAVEMDDKNDMHQLPAVPILTVDDDDEAESRGRTIDVRTRFKTMRSGVLSVYLLPAFVFFAVSDTSTDKTRTFRSQYCTVLLFRQPSV